MELKKLVRTDGENGEAMEGVWALTHEQVSFLISYAIQDLISRGAASVANITPEQYEQWRNEQEAADQAAFLAGADTTNMGQA